MPVKITNNPNGGYEIAVKIDREMMIDRDGSTVREAVQEIVRAFAEEWVIDNLNDVFKHINAEAVANAVLIEASNIIAARVTHDDKKSE